MNLHDDLTKLLNAAEGDDLLQVIQTIIQQRDALQTAIRKHRDQRGDDRCWLDDAALYSVLPEGHTTPKQDTAVELERCKQYIATRHNPNTTYISPQRRIEQLEQQVKNLQDRINKVENQNPLIGGP